MYRECQVVQRNYPFEVSIVVEDCFHPTVHTRIFRFNSVQELNRFISELDEDVQTDMVSILGFPAILKHVEIFQNDGPISYKLCSSSLRANLELGAVE